MTNLTDLDLSGAYVVESQEKHQYKVRETKFLAELLGLENEARYHKDRDKIGYKVRSELIDVMDKYADRESKAPRDDTKCELPEGAFSDLYFLESIRLPEHLTDFEGKVSQLVKSGHFKEVWLSKNAHRSVVDVVKRDVCREKQNIIKFY